MKSLVIGLGRAGIRAGELLGSLGHQVYGYDDNPAPSLLRDNPVPRGFSKVFLKTLPENFLDSIDLVLLSPGISPENTLVRQVRETRARVLGEAAFALELVKCPVVCVTGTNGKTTTTELTGRILGCSLERVAVCGNNGKPVSSLFNGGEFPFQACVVEMSSFMIDLLERHQRFQVTMLLNLTPDHLDRYGTEGSYYQSKLRLMEQTAPGGTAIVNLGCPATLEGLKGLQQRALAGNFRLAGFAGPGNVVPENILNKCSIVALCQGSRVMVLEDGEDRGFHVETASRHIQGDHNMENIMAALLAARALGLSPQEIEQGIGLFEPVEHRMEPAGTIQGRRFINDSKGTNEDATIKALKSYNGPLTLIAGGYDKGASFRDLAETLAGRPETRVVVMGATGPRIGKVIAETPGTEEPIAANGLEEALRLALDATPVGGTVLFSPGCASYDAFRDFEERGRIFKELVADLAREVGP